MQKAKKVFENLTSQDGKHTTTVDEEVRRPVTDEHVRPKEHEAVTTAREKEVHQDHHHTTVQPVQDTETLLVNLDPNHCLDSDTVHLAPRNILTRFYPLRKEPMSTATTKSLKGFLNVMQPSIKTHLLSMTPPIPPLRRRPSPVNNGTITFTSTSSRLSRKKL